MSPATLQRDDKSFVPVLYMAMELSNRNWKLLFGDGARRCQLSIAAGELLRLHEAVIKARQRFELPVSTRVVSCYEAGRDGFWLHRYLESIGVENVVVDRRVLRFHGASTVRRPIGWMRSSYCDNYPDTGGIRTRAVRGATCRHARAGRISRFERAQRLDRRRQARRPCAARR